MEMVTVQDLSRSPGVQRQRLATTPVAQGWGWDGSLRLFLELVALCKFRELDKAQVGWAFSQQMPFFLGLITSFTEPGTFTKDPSRRGLATPLSLWATVKAQPAPLGGHCINWY